MAVVQGITTIQAMATTQAMEMIQAMVVVGDMVEDMAVDTKCVNQNKYVVKLRAIFAPLKVIVTSTILAIMMHPVCVHLDAYQMVNVVVVVVVHNVAQVQFAIMTQHWVVMFV
jgi:hypothetical protein